MKKIMKNKKLYKIWTFLLVIALIAGAFIIADNYNVRATEYTVEAATLPKSFDNFKIVQISDLHNTEFGKDNEKLLKIIKEQNPDVVVVTGDTIDGFFTNIQTPIKLFEEVLEICDVYLVVGNHEIRSDSTLYFDFLDTLTEMGVVVLKDESAYIEKNGEKIQVIGLNDASNYKAVYGDTYKEALTEAINTLDEEDAFTVLLSHHPELFKEYAKTDVDLVFSGHAHGGQVRIPFLGGIIAPDQGVLPQYTEGSFTENNTTMIVSRGLGNSIIPLRINNPPEVVVVNLKAK